MPACCQPAMRLLLLILVALTVAIQYPLWWGKGGWLRVQQLQQKVTAQQETNAALEARNNALVAEVQDLKTGTAAVEERARTELGLIREGEVFVDILAPGQAVPPASVKPPGRAGSTR